MSTRSKSSSRGVSAVLGDTIIIRKVRGQYQLINRPARPAKPTPRQAVRREKFREASQYAKAQISLADSNALYAKGITRRKHTTYLVALSDYLNDPKVKLVDAFGYRGEIGDTILVKATDDFRVTKVKIVITDAAGVLIEDGEATLDAQMADDWKYKATVSNPARTGTTIRAIAYDRPGNRGMGEIVL